MEFIYGGGAIMMSCGRTRISQVYFMMISFMTRCKFSGCQIMHIQDYTTIILNINGCHQHLGFSSVMLILDFFSRKIVLELECAFKMIAVELLWLGQFGGSPCLDLQEGVWICKMLFLS